MKKTTTVSTAQSYATPWLLLLAFQVSLGAIVFSTFLSGQGYFAYLDIGSDSIMQVVPGAIHMVRSLSREGFTGWSFEIGLGGVPSFWLVDLFAWVNVITGSDHVLPARIGIYLLKLSVGGFTCLLLLLSLMKRWQVAVLFALSYSFCGFIIINGQWDVEATAFALYPLTLWGCLRQLRLGSAAGYFVLPMSVAVALLGGLFPLALAVFIFLVCLLFAACRPSKRSIRHTLLLVAPLVSLGFLLASPVVLPLTLQLLDTSRVSGGDSIITTNFAQSFSPNSSIILAAELGGFFHKDLFGIGSYYAGYWNYLEAPGFYVGVLSLILIPQLGKQSDLNRWLLYIGSGVLVLYVTFPFLRYLTMGFAAPYFRVSTLWISLGMLLLAARALDTVWFTGIHLKTLVLSTIFCVAALIAICMGPLASNVSSAHLYKVLALLVLATGILIFICYQWIRPAYAFQVLLLFVALESVLIMRPSLIEGRSIATANSAIFGGEVADILDSIRAQDSSFYRLEKTFNSASLNDAQIQDYFGVQSYYMHSKGEVDFFRGAGLIPQTNPQVNYTNWLPNTGERFMLNSLLGVKYIIANKYLDWPGFSRLPGSSSSNFFIYRNALALPLGIVQTQQVSEEDILHFSEEMGANKNIYKDIILLNAVVTKQPVTAMPKFPIEELIRSNAVSLADRYMAPARALQMTGLQIEHFSSNNIIGSIHPIQAGMLIFSIPFNSGWELRVDGKIQSLIRVNFGFMGSAVSPGTHRIELTFTLPGLQNGLFLAMLGILLSFAIELIRRRQRTT